MRTANPAFSTLSEMEDSVRNVARWGHVLRNLGAGTSMIEPGALWVVGHSLEQLGEEIEARWEEAFRAQRGQA